MTKQQFIDLLNAEITNRISIINKCMTRQNEVMVTQAPSENIGGWIERWQSVFSWSIGDYMSGVEVLSLLMKVKNTIEFSDDIDIKKYLVDLKAHIEENVFRDAKMINRSSSATANFARHHTMLGQITFLEHYLQSPFGEFVAVMKHGIGEDGGEK